MRNVLAAAVPRPRRCSRWPAPAGRRAARPACCTGAHTPSTSLEDLAPLVQGPRRRRSRRACRCTPRGSRRDAAASANRGSSTSSGWPTAGTSSGQKRSACSIIRMMKRPSLGSVVADERVGHGVRSSIGHACRARTAPAADDVGRTSPTCRCASSELSTTERLAGALAVEQRGRDAAGDGQPAEEVAERRARRAGRVRRPRWRGDVGDAAAAPRRRCRRSRPCPPRAPRARCPSRGRR